MNRQIAFLCLVVSGAFVASTALAADPAMKCESKKLKEMSSYCKCLLKAQSKSVLRGQPPDFSRCDTKLDVKWSKVDQLLGGACPTSQAVDGDKDFGSAVCVDATTEIADCLEGGPCGLPLSCMLPASGQSTPYGTGSDGDIQAGAVLSYTDNGDGTVTDNNTGLMWEKKGDSGNVHDKDNVYTWTVVSNDMDGEITTVFLDALNDVGGGGASCFAEYCDWRIPNARELHSIIDYERLNPAVNPVFHQAGTCTACADITQATCSCTGTSTRYWSSTTRKDAPGGAWVVNFEFGGIDRVIDKPNGYHVRAVRGGL